MRTRKVVDGRANSSRDRRLGSRELEEEDG